MDGAALIDRLGPVGAWLLGASLSAAGIAIGVLLIQSLLGRWLTPAWRYRLWGLVVLRLLLPTLPASPTSLSNLDLLRPIKALLARASQPAERAPARPVIQETSSTLRITVGLLPPERPSRVLPQVAPAPIVHAPDATRMIPTVTATVWLVGVAILLARLISANVALARRLRPIARVTDPSALKLLDECCRALGVSRPPPLLVTRAVAAPAADGVFRPRILLPHGLLETLSADERRAVLLHELAHVRCRDVAGNWLVALIQIVHWFNPVLWLAFARMRADREAARDAMVLHLLPTGDAPAQADGYGQTLLKLAERLSLRTDCLALSAGAAGIVGPSSPLLMPGLFGSRSNLQRRLRMIQRYPAGTGRLWLIGPTLALVLAAATLTRAQERPAPRADSKRSDSPATQKDTRSVADLIVDARRKTAVGWYRDALTIVDRILALDPKNEYALGVRPLLHDKIQLTEKQIENERQERPLDQTIAAERKPNKEDLTLQAQLDRKLPELSFDGVALSDVVDFLRDVSGANIFVNWKALEGANINGNTPVTARMRNIPLSKAIRVILDAVSGEGRKLSYAVEDGTITISTADDLGKNVMTRVYDIRDLLVSVADFEPDKSAVGGTPGTQPAEKEPTTRPAPTREQRVQEIIRLIEDTVASDSWKDRGGSVATVRELQGQLIITQTPENQREVVALLEQLREGHSIQVTVEARYISCDEQVIKDLIAEWQKAAPKAAEPGAAMRPAGAFTDMFLTDAQAEQFLRATQDAPASAVLAAPRMTLFNGQRAYVLVSSQRSYVRDYATVKTKAGDTRYDPVVAVADPGLLMDVQATVSADRKFVTLTLRPRVSALVGMKQSPWRNRPEGSNLQVDEPQIRTSELQTTASVPNHGTLLVGGLEDPGIGAQVIATTQPHAAPATQPAGHLRSLFLLVKPSIIMQREVEQKPFPLLQPKAAK